MSEVFKAFREGDLGHFVLLFIVFGLVCIFHAQSAVVVAVAHDFRNACCLP